MRTKVEIEERMKHWEEQVVKCNDCLSEEEAYQKTAYARGASTLLAWVLEEPTYKRTIYDLTKEEITSLFARIGINNDYEDISEISISKYSDSIKVYFTEYKTGIEGDCIYLENEYIIEENLDVYCLIDSYKCYAVTNQAEFIDTIRVMLS